jgi:hypothetical protein
LQVNTNEPAMMNLTLNNATNAILQGPRREREDRGRHFRSRPAHAA